MKAPKAQPTLFSKQLCDHYELLSSPKHSSSSSRDLGLTEIIFVVEILQIVDPLLYCFAERFNSLRALSGEFLKKACENNRWN